LQRLRHHTADAPGFVATRAAVRAGEPACPLGGAPLPAPLDGRFEAVIFDWDGTAVPDRRAGTTALRRLITALCGRGMELAVVTGTHADNIDAQLRTRPPGPGRLHLCVNRGSEVYAVERDGLRLLFRRTATPAEDAALTKAATRTVEALRERGLEARIVSDRLNRRKIDLIPEPRWGDPPKALIAELLTHVQKRLERAGFGGLDAVQTIARRAATDAGLKDARVTSDVKHVEIGLTDKSDSARWLLDNLWERGIGADLALIVGDEMGPLGGVPGSDSRMLLPEAAAAATAVSVGIEPAGVPAGVLAVPGGPHAFRAILRNQLERRRRGDVPRVSCADGWTIDVVGIEHEMEHVNAVLLALGDGLTGTNGAPLAGDGAAMPRTLVAGIYDGAGPDQTLAALPVWTRIATGGDVQPAVRRTLDLHTGVLRQEIPTDVGGVEAVLFPSLAEPGTCALRACGPRACLAGAGALTTTGESLIPLTTSDGATTATVGSVSGGADLAIAASQDLRHPGADVRPSLDRFAIYTPGALGTALGRLRAARTAGFEVILHRQREAWAGRWSDADIGIGGDAELQRDVRFALYHLMASVADRGEAPVGARGLSGLAYHGHVFWDADVFVLPYLAATHPSAARAMLEYRVRRLPAALEAARGRGLRGARFPWESAVDGSDVTPGHARDQTGAVVRIRTGELQEHIVADVAWSAAWYVEWTGDETFRRGPGRQLMIQTARYWASRIAMDADGTAHIRGVIGPDEYHEEVDDNAFTNVMARWNLRRAADEAGASVDQAETSYWRSIADALVDGHDPATNLYEQFTGFWELEPLIIAELAPRRPIAADLLLGAERVRGSQVIKQADTLMLHHLVPEAVAPGSLEPNLAFYEPRTAHGSSLSPGVHAALLARAGRHDAAMDALRIASRIDLDDLTGSTAGGLHLATMGSVWQALVLGMAGVRARRRVLHIDPSVPGCLGELRITVRFLQSRVSISIHGGGIDVSATDPVWVCVAGTRTPVTVGPHPVTFRHPVLRRVTS
jgi:hypothetical protein